MPTGTVKWFNAKKGYGFITDDETKKDIFLHVTALESSKLSLDVHFEIDKVPCDEIFFNSSLIKPYDSNVLPTPWSNIQDTISSGFGAVCNCINLRNISSCAPLKKTISFGFKKNFAIKATLNERMLVIVSFALFPNPIILPKKTNLSPLVKFFSIWLLIDFKEL